jgi:hypothetical protein
MPTVPFTPDGTMRHLGHGQVPFGPRDDLMYGSRQTRSRSLWITTDLQVVELESPPEPASPRGGLHFDASVAFSCCLMRVSLLVNRVYVGLRTDNLSLLADNVSSHDPNVLRARGQCGLSFFQAVDVSSHGNRFHGIAARDHLFRSKPNWLVPALRRPHLFKEGSGC